MGCTHGINIGMFSAIHNDLLYQCIFSFSKFLHLVLQAIVNTIEGEKLNTFSNLSFFKKQRNKKEKLHQVHSFHK
jgi:hypothetical protein